MNHTMHEILNFALDRYIKICAFKFGGGELYIKVYTKRSVEEVIKEFEEQCFDVVELFDTIREPTLIENDAELGVEIIITFSIPIDPKIMLISNEPEN